MKTDSEICERIGAITEEDGFGFERQLLVTYLGFEAARPYLREGLSKEDWEPHWREPNEENVRKDMLDYLPFAWEKANGCRGISAIRSLLKFRAWIWFLGEDDLYEEIMGGDYQWYGKPQLILVSKLVDFDWKEADSNEWRNDEMDDAVTAAEAMGWT